MHFPLLTSLRVGCQAVAHEWRSRRRQSAMRRVAQAFNALHTHPSQRRRRWMCPACNRVREPRAWDALNGLTFDGCCGQIRSVKP